MPNPQEIAEVVVNGQAYRDWQSVSVSHGYGEISDSFVFTAAAPIESDTGWAAQKLKVGDLCKVRLGGVSVIDGIITTRQAAYDDQQHGLQVSGLSKLSVGLQSSVDPAKSEFRGYNFAQIARSVLQPYGLTLNLQGSPEGADQPFPKVNGIPGETILSFIDRLARMRNLHLLGDAQGNLKATRGVTAGAGAELVEGLNIKRAQCSMSDDEVYGKLTSTGSGPGNDQRNGPAVAQVSATALNPSTTSKRQLIFVSEEPAHGQQDQQMRADREAAENMAAQLNASIAVQGWFAPGGQLWINMVGQTVSVRSPMLFPWNEMQLAIESVTHSQSDAGTETELKLCLVGRLGGPDRLSGSGDDQAGGAGQSPTKSAPPPGAQTKPAQPDIAET